jgi:hypothetical protein
MPQAPGLYPTAEPSSQGAPEVNLPVPTDAFGGAVGHALEGLGSGIEHVSDQVWQRAMDMQNLQNETTAKEGDAKAMVDMGKAHADFLNKQGNNASPEAFEQHIQDLQNIRLKYRQGMNPMAARMYDASSLSFMGRSIFNAAGHSGQQMKVAANGADAARGDIASDHIGDNPTDVVGFQRGIRVIQSGVDQTGARMGWSPEQIQNTRDMKVSNAVAKRIVGLSRTDAIGAKAMFDNAVKQGALNPVDASKVEASVQSQFRQQGSRNISDQVLGDFRNGGDTDKTEQDFIDEGQKQADATAQRLGITDPLFKDFVRDRVSADYRRQMAVSRDGQQASEQSVAAAMMTGNKEGVLPKSVDELKLIDPSVASAWDNLKPTTQKRYMAALANNANGDKVAWNDDSLRTYQMLKGQAAENPVEFLAHDVIGDKLPASGKRELINLQQRMMKQSTQDPRVGRALQTLAPDLQAAGISPKADSDGYYQFVGGLQDALDSYQQSNPGKVPSLDDIRTMGARLMQDQNTGRRGWLFFNNEKAPLYNMPVPDDEAKRIRQDPFWSARGIANPTDFQVQRFYHTEQYRTLYGSPAKKPAP